MEKLSPKEMKEKKELQTSYRYVILRPGGNDTALIRSPMLSPNRRVEISSQIMQFYPNIEQVGFVNFKDCGPELTMAGGEFCGNATRSTGYIACGGKRGEVNITVSGVEKTLQTGVTANNEAFAQMPIYQDPEKISSVGLNGNSWLVEMEGITHLVTFDTKEIENLGREEIKKIARTKIKKMGLMSCSAAGVIYAAKIAEGFEIKPVVWVKKTKDLFYETACGSGTTALGLVLAKILGKGVNVPVIQPSGLPINIQIEFDGNKFQSAQIKGPIQELGQGTLEQTKKGLFVVEQVNDQEQLENAFCQGLVDLYKQIFTQPPYQELFSEKEIINLFSEYLRVGIVFLARSTEKIVGFGAALLLDQIPEIAAIASSNGLDPKQTWYMADLGVDENFREIGLGSRLIKARIDLFAKGSTILVRTSINNTKSQKLYSDLGFSVISNMTQSVEQERTNGQKKTDQRIFMVKKI